MFCSWVFGSLVCFDDYWFGCLIWLSGCFSCVMHCSCVVWLVVVLHWFGVSLFVVVSLRVWLWFWLIWVFVLEFVECDDLGGDLIVFVWLLRFSCVAASVYVGVWGVCALLIDWILLSFCLGTGGLGFYLFVLLCACILVICYVFVLVCFICWYLDCFVWLLLFA